MPDGVREDKENLNYEDLEDVNDLSKESIQISFRHKKNGFYFFHFNYYMKNIHLRVSCENPLLLNQIDEAVKLFLIPNFSKTVFDNKINNIDNPNVSSTNQGEEKSSQKIDSAIDLSNATLKNSPINISNTKIEDSTVRSSATISETSSPKNSWSWITILAAAVTIISGIIAIWKFFLQPSIK